MSQQLPLPVKLDDYAVFTTFLVDRNTTAVSHLESLCATSGGVGAWLWGAAASGKTHLLQAVCERAGNQAAYLPLIDLKPVGPDVLSGMSDRAFVCLDDVDSVAGDPDWERALFNLFEAVTASASTIVVTAKGPQRQIPFSLADLASRYSLLPAFRVHALDDEGRLQALMLRARHRGLELPEETARFLAARARRDMASLHALLDRLDDQALVAQRRLTIPFVRDVLRR